MSNNILPNAPTNIKLVFEVGGVKYFDAHNLLKAFELKREYEFIEVVWTDPSIYICRRLAHINLRDIQNPFKPYVPTRGIEEARDILQRIKKMIKEDRSVVDMFGNVMKANDFLLQILYPSFWTDVEVVPGTGQPEYILRTTFKQLDAGGSNV